MERESQGIRNVIEAQTEICRVSEDFVLASVRAVELPELGMMQDRMHYSQEGYNLIGEEAGRNAGIYVKTGNEPAMYDPYTGTEYIPENP